MAWDGNRRPRRASRVDVLTVEQRAPAGRLRHVSITVSWSLRRARRSRNRGPLAHPVTATTMFWWGAATSCDPVGTRDFLRRGRQLLALETSGPRYFGPRDLTRRGGPKARVMGMERLMHSWNHLSIRFSIQSSSRSTTQTGCSTG